MRVKLDSGALASVTELALLGGANLAAVRNADGEWEVLQFLSAVLTAPATYTLTGFLRGQAGTEHAMRAPLAAGARFVLLDGALARIDLTEDEIGLAFNWRCGPASRDLGSPNYVQLAHTFAGEGLKPLSPVHVRGTRTGGDLNLTWVRRTRIGGDCWDAIEVPLGEAEERYEIDILDGATVKRTLTATAPAATYTAAQQTADFGAPQILVSLRIHQISATRGRGTPREAVAVGGAGVRPCGSDPMAPPPSLHGHASRRRAALRSGRAHAVRPAGSDPSQPGAHLPTNSRHSARPHQMVGHLHDHLGRRDHRLSTVLPASARSSASTSPPELVRQLGDQVVLLAVQAIGGLAGTILTIYGRVRATTALERRQVSADHVRDLARAAGPAARPPCIIARGRTLRSDRRRPGPDPIVRSRQSNGGEPCGSWLSRTIAISIASWSRR